MSITFSTRAVFIVVINNNSDDYAGPRYFYIINGESSN